MKQQPIKSGFVMLALIMVFGAELRSQTIQDKIAYQYGLPAFEKISSIKFTFNRSKNGNSISRRWLWRPKENLVSQLSLENDSVLICYSPWNLNKQDFRLSITDQLFQNDRHWLLFPFHLIWDSGTYTLWEENIKAPVSGKYLNCLTILYPGYEHAPGNIYKLFVDEELKIREWSYCKSGARDQPMQSMTWKGHWYYGELLLSTMRIGEGGDFKVWFTDIEVSYDAYEDH